MAPASSTACCASSSSTSLSPSRVATAFVAPAWCGRWTTSRPARFGKDHGHGVWWKGGGHGHHGQVYYCKEKEGYTNCRLYRGHGCKKSFFCPVHKCYYKKKCFY